jgi:AbiV family abortive infection protein
MSQKEKQEEGKYQRAIRACVENGCALLEDAELMHSWERYGTAYALSILAEEEFSKGFLLYLVQDNAIPWTTEVRRAVRNQESKHLLAVLMEHLAERGENWLEDITQRKQPETQATLPGKVAAAINLFRYEKIGKWEDPFSWDVLEPEDYDPDTKRVADGSVDRAKQSAIYVNIGRDGTTLTTPSSVSSVQTANEIDRYKRLEELATGMAHGAKGYIIAGRFSSSSYEATVGPDHSG